MNKFIDEYSTLIISIMVTFIVLNVFLNIASLITNKVWYIDIVIISVSLAVMLVGSILSTINDKRLDTLGSFFKREWAAYLKEEAKENIGEMEARSTQIGRFLSWGLKFDDNFLKIHNALTIRFLISGVILLPFCVVNLGAKINLTSVFGDFLPLFMDFGVLAYGYAILVWVVFVDIIGDYKLMAKIYSDPLGTHNKEREYGVERKGVLDYFKIDNLTELKNKMKY